MSTVLYVYAIARDAVTPHGEAVDGSDAFVAVSVDGLSAIATPVARDTFSQEAIDRRAGDLEWLGAIGYRHQAVVSQLMKSTAIVPLRAFTLFSGDAAVRDYLAQHRQPLLSLLERLDGKQEWTLRVEFDPETWNGALAQRVESLRAIEAQLATAGAGKAFLLRKKAEEEKKRASREAEQQVVGEIEQAVLAKLACETVAETRQQRGGAFPQLNVLLNRDEEAVLQELHTELTARYAAEGVSVALTGPWPPYSFAAMNEA